MPRPFRPSVVIAGVALLATAAPSFALRVATYNILNWSSGRTAAFQTVLGEMQPDVLVVEEIYTQGAVDSYVSSVLNVVNPGEWTSGDFVDGADSDNAFFYRPAKVTYVGHHVISTDLRDIDEWTIRPATHTSSDADLRLYVAHLKSSQGSDNEQKRLGEVTAMRTRMETFPAGQSYSMMGDFNIYTFTEPAYQYMLNIANGASGVLQDPINRPGNWHNNETFADIHTQSPRVTQFGGGANGGMDDRFDMILTSPADLDGEGIDILPASYTALGQDGAHFDGALNVPPYTVVSAAVAQALHDASDHLPVFADYQMPAGILMVASLDLGSILVGGSTSADLAVENDTPAPADELDYSFSAPTGFTAPAGSFQADAGSGATLHSIDLDGSSVGVKSGDLQVTTDDPDAPLALVALTGAVLDHAVPSVRNDQVQLADLLDLGSVTAGDTASVSAEAHNFGWGALTALLDVYDAVLSGDPAFFLPGGFTPVQAGASPAMIPVSFDAAGASVGVHNGMLTLSTRDEALPGGIDLDDLVLDLTVNVETNVASPVIASVERSGFVAVAPNPFRPSTEIRFGLRQAGSAELRIFDVQGRAVRTLVHGELAAGRHRATWDGRDSAGQDLAPGIYFAQLVTAESRETRKLVRLR
jgi:hypothetical protein